MTARERPTLEELRSRVHKGRHREIGNWLARNWARPTAVYGTWLALRMGLSAHQVTLLALAASLASAAGLGSGSRGGFVAGVALAWLAFWLDRVDGQVARWRRTVCLEGVYLDYLMHHVAAMSQAFGLGFGLTLATGEPRWALAGFLVAAGWTVLGLHNDCRYKAFFQRLKRESRTYRVDGGSGGRPAPPAPWPRRGRGMLTWPAFKACEPHAVLVALGGLGVAAVFSGSAWLGLLKCYVGAMTVIAPLLASARVARAVGRGTVEEEFARWFRSAPRG